MKLCNILTIGTEPLLRNRLRASLSILGIFIGIAGVLCMMMLSEGAKKLIADDIDKLGGANQFLIPQNHTTTFQQNIYPPEYFLDIQFHVHIIAI